MSGDVYWDIDLTWDVNDVVSVTFGGNNIFDAGPDTNPFNTCCGAPADETTVMGWQGPYYYARGVFRWN
jgi:iron complex outermembrane receptor protein